MAKTPQGIWYVEPSTPVDPVLWTQSLAESMEPSTDYDTGWVSVVTTPRLIQVRRIGRTVHCVINGALGLGSGSSFDLLPAGGLPAQFRPTAETVLAAHSDRRPITVTAWAGGSISVSNHSGSTTTNIRANGVWVLA